MVVACTSMRLQLIAIGVARGGSWQSVFGLTRGALLAGYSWLTEWHGALPLRNLILSLSLSLLLQANKRISV